MKSSEKRVLIRVLALVLAFALVATVSIISRNTALKASEEGMEEVFVEAPAPEAPPVVVEPVVEVPAEPAPAEEPVVVSEEIDAAEITEAPAEEAPAEEAPAEEEPFDVAEAYKYYCTLGEAEKQAYLESLTLTQRSELEQYILLMEAPAALAEDEQEAEEPEEEEEKAEEAEALPAGFGSARVSGEWAGRDTSTPRSLSIEVYVDGELADSCSTTMNKSVANFSVAIGDCTVESESSSCGGFSGSNGSYSVDMYADTFATVTVKLASPEAEEEKNEPIELDVNIWYECPEGKVKVGRTLIWKSEVTNATEDMVLHYQWQYDRGNGWEDIPGANDPEYSLVVSRENAAYSWRLIVNSD